MKPNHPVIVAAGRTAIGRYKGGWLNVRADDLLAVCLKALLEQCNPFAAEALDELIVGCGNQAGEDSRNVARLAALLADIPVSVPAVTVNRLCGSGLSALLMGANAIEAGQSEVVLAAGLEQMSRSPLIAYPDWVSLDQEPESSVFGWRFTNPAFLDSPYYGSMVDFAEKLAQQHQVGRSLQEDLALASHQKALKATKAGCFKPEILDLKGLKATLAQDEPIREGLTVEVLARLKPLLANGTITAATAAPWADGAAAVLLMSEQKAAELGLKPLASVLASVTIGVEPSQMGLGPVGAIEKLLQKTGLSLADISIIDLHEAFAATHWLCLQQLGLSPHDKRVNPWGGALALGAPMGALSLRQVVTATHQLQQGGGPYALVALPVGMGQAMALLLKRPSLG